MLKKTIFVMEVTGSIIATIAAIIFGIDYFFHTHIVQNVAQHNSILGAFLDVGRQEIPYEKVDDNDQFYIYLKNHIKQITPPNSVKAIKVQTISDQQKKFIIEKKDGKLIVVLLTKKGSTFTVQKSKD